MQEGIQEGYSYVRGYLLFYVEADEYCPYCDNKYVLDAVTKEDK